MQLETDDMVAVTLDGLARETGGRWIRWTNDLDKELGRIVRQNGTSYLLAYESPSADDPGRHRISVRVRRTDARVYARRGYIADPR